VSAPKTPEGRAAALAKQRETTRRRSTTELRADIEQLATRLRYGGETWRADLEALRWILSVVADFVQETPSDEETIEQLNDIRYTLLELSKAQSQKRQVRLAQQRAAREQPKQERLRAQGEEILRSMLASGHEDMT
jgi:hypothetical protein